MHMENTDIRLDRSVTWMSLREFIGWNWWSMPRSRPPTHCLTMALGHPRALQGVCGSHEIELQEAHLLKDDHVMVHLHLDGEGVLAHDGRPPAIQYVAVPPKEAPLGCQCAHLHPVQRGRGVPHQGEVPKDQNVPVLHLGAQQGCGVVRPQFGEVVLKACVILQDEDLVDALVLAGCRGAFG